MTSSKITTQDNVELEVSDIVSVLPFRDNLLLALTVGEDGKAQEHKVNASEYYFLKGR